MRHFFNPTVFTFLLSIAFTSQAQQSVQSITTNAPAPTPYAIVQRDANSRIWENTTYEVLPSGQSISHLHRYTEVASGLCYWQKGQWLDSQEQINILPDGTAAATNGQHQAYFPGDIYKGAIELVTPDGLQLQSRPIGLSYDDGTNTVLIAELTNSIGQLISSNEVIYTNAFVGVSADVLYTYRKGGFEQDVIFREQPPTPEQCGLDSGCSRLQLLTEFFNPPTPVESANSVNSKDGLQDMTLSFGSMTMVHGRAFLTGNDITPKNLNSVPVCKSWTAVDGRTLLMEETPCGLIEPALKTLPPSSSAISVSRNTTLYKISSKRILPVARGVENIPAKIQLAKLDSAVKPGVVFDYVTVGSAVTNFTFQGDMTYYFSGSCRLKGATTLEGGAVIKCKFNYYSDSITIDGNGTLNCQTAPYRPGVFTSVNDNSVGETISGSSGAPDLNDIQVLLNVETTNTTFQNLRFCYAIQGIQQVYEPNSYIFRDCQFMNVAVPIFANNVELFNVLMGCSPNEYSEIIGEGVQQLYVSGNVVAENVTADSGYGFLYANNPDEVFALTNCLVTDEPMTNGASFGATLWTNNVIYVSGSPSPPIYKIVGNGNYYLTNNSPYRAVGSPNLDSNLLADLSQKTTFPPMVYSNYSFSTPTNLNQYAARDTNTYPDLGYHYDPLDYAIGGCAVSTNLTFATGTAVAWFQCSGPVNLSGQPYALGLQNGAKISFNGNVTQPCFYPSVPMVQEGANIWNTRSGNIGSIVFNGSGSTPLPSLYADFTKFTVQDGWNIFRDNSAHGTADFINSEFYNIAASTYDMDSMYFTNCLFFRGASTYWYSPSLSYVNCTFYNGCLTIYRNGSPVLWQIENCAFDGTMLAWQDIYNGTSHTTIDHNAYNTNNLSWETYPYQYPPVTNELEVIGSSDLMMTNFNWQTSWFGDFYLPPDSPIIQAGGATAANVGLYHFTTQTNQIPDGTNIVTIGYHYVATDQYGNPLDSNGDGIPDYLEDSAGNGSGNWNNTMIFNVIIAKPRNGSMLP